MNNILRLSTIFLLILFLSFYLFEYANNKNNAERLQLINQLQELKILDIDIDNNFIKVSENIYINYDSTSQATTDAAELLQVLKKQKWKKKYRQYLEEVDSTFQLKLSNIERLKRENSVLRNSIQFLTHLANEIIQMDDVDHLLMKKIHRSLWNVNYLKQSGDTTFLNEIRNTIKFFSTYESHNPKINRDLRTITKHLEVILLKLPPYVSLLQGTLDIPTSNHLKRFIDILENERKENIQQNRVYEGFSILFIFFLGIIIFFLNRKQEKYQASLLESAKVDALTGASNRYALSQDLTKMKPPFTIMIFNIDKFRFLNDAYGGDQADKLLVYFSKALNSEFNMKVYRKGADEFALLLEESEAEIVSYMVAWAYHRITAGSDITFTFSSLLYHCHKQVSLQELEHDLQAGMFSAKKQGGKRIYTYDEKDKNVIEYKNLSKNAHKDRKKIIAALRADRFIPYFQPIMDIKTGKIYKYETLARMQEGSEILTPYKFILIAEHFNLIGEITRKIMAKTFLKVKENPDVSFSINLSAHDISDPGLLNFIETALRQYQINPAQITFEITETATMGDFNESITFINSLKEMGFSFAIDDFGVGQSSLQYLRDLPADYIKIDGSFIKDIAVSSSTREFVSLINQVIRLHGKKSVGEYAENEDIIKVMKEIGIDYAQGYYIGKPEPELLS